MSILRGAGVKHERRECEIYRDVFSDKRKGTGCKGRIVKEEELLKEIADQMGWDEFNEERFLEEVVRVDVGTDEIVITRKTAA